MRDMTRRPSARARDGVSRERGSGNRDRLALMQPPPPNLSKTLTTMAPAFTTMGL